MDKIIEVGQDMFLIIEVIMETIWEVIRRMKDKIITITEGETLGTKIMKIGVGHMIGNNRWDNRSNSNSRSRWGSRVSTNRDRIRCFECREYDHFTRDCLMTQADREVEQVQQMFNMDEDQTILQKPQMDVDQVRQSVSPTESRENLNL